MLAEDRDAVICDLAETYHVLDYRALSVDILATLCVGLREDSRIKMKMAGMTRVAESFVLVNIADTLTAIAFGLSGKKTASPPEMLSDIVRGKRKEKQTVGFASPEEFEEARRKILGG